MRESSKSLFPFSKVFIPHSSPKKELCGVFGVFFPLLIPDFQGSPTLSNNFLSLTLGRGRSALSCPVHQTLPLLIWTPLPPLTALTEKGRCLQTQALSNLSRLNGSCLPKNAGQLFLEDAKNTIYGQSKQKSRAGKSECNTYSIVR